MKLLKILIGTIITLILLFIAGIVVLVTLINPNDFKSQITEAVHQKTGRELTIGNINWSFFPWLGVKVNNVSFENGSDFKGDFIKVGEADLRVEFLPIFKGQIKVGTLNLKGADIHLMKNKAGKTNWQDLVEDTTDNEKPKTEDSVPEKSSKIALVSISNIDISNSNVSWNDAQAGQKLDVQNFNLRCKGIEIDSNAQELSDQVKFQGAVTIGQITANKLRINNIKTYLSFEHGIAALKPLQANLYGGKLNANIVINLKNKVPSISIEESLAGLQLESLLKDLTNTSVLSGVANVSVNVTTAGSDGNSILKNLNGSGQFSVNKGDLKGVDIDAIISTADSLINKLPLPKVNHNATDFNSLTGSFTIHNGVVSNNDLSLKGDKFQLSGQGTVNLVSTGVNYRVKAAKVSGSQVDQLLVPINITGTFSNLSYTPDFSHFLQNKVETMIKNTVTGKPIQDLGRGIGNLFH